jgi:DNA repair protein RecO
MAHHIYTTDAFILESQLSGEADRYFTLFTKDFGLIRATARGVRLAKSKLRYSLQELSRSRISLVRGKEVWRITSARIEENLFSKYRNQKPVLYLIAQISTLIKRLVGGEEKNEPLFMIVSDVISFLESKTFSDQELKYVEIIAVLRILHNLGYLRNTSELQPFVHSGWSDALLSELEPHKNFALREINTSLRETQL